MIGIMISKIRKEKGITKTRLAELTDINIGHLTHIEKGERSPSHKALRSICSALSIPYEQLLYTYDKELTEEQLNYNYINYISSNQVPAFSKIEDFITCPSDYSNASFAYKVPDNSMAPLLKENTYAYVEFSGLLSNKEVGFFKYNNEFLIRRIVYKRGKILLRADSKEVEDIHLQNNDDFKIIGKVYI